MDTVWQLFLMLIGFCALGFLISIFIWAFICAKEEK